MDGYDIIRKIVVIFDMVIIIKYYDLTISILTNTFRVLRGKSQKCVL